MRQKAIYFPGLNGLRAIAALSVVVSHITLALADFGLNPHIFGSFKDGKPIGLYLGAYGVSIFFALSGFLITYLLLAEQELHPINIRKFYVRRILRIWPLYYAYLVLAVLTIFLYKLNFNQHSFLLYIFYCANIPFILNTTLPFLNHYWSLGVEEQFYLFWPWIIKKLKGNLNWVIVGMILILVATKLVAYILHPNSLLAGTLIVTRFHCMMIGGLGALLYKQQKTWFLAIATNRWTQIGCWLIIGLSAINKFQIASIIDNELISTISVLLIIGQVCGKHKFINLENKACDFLGKISYGIYVIHPLVIFYVSKFFANPGPASIMKYLLVYSMVIVATILLAYLSYEYFEKYFLKIKSKYTVVKSESTRQENFADIVSTPTIKAGV